MWQLISGVSRSYHKHFEPVHGKSLHGMNQSLLSHLIMPCHVTLLFFTITGRICQMFLRNHDAYKSAICSQDCCQEYFSQSTG